VKANSLLEAKNVVPTSTINEGICYFLNFFRFPSHSLDYISLQNYYSIKLENEKLKTTQQNATAAAEKYKIDFLVCTIG
jgi:hypothetical protein